MPDIFDEIEIAEPVTRRPSGDIFDQLESEDPVRTMAKAALSDVALEKRGWPTVPETSPFYDDELVKLSPQQRKEYFASKGRITTGEKIQSRDLNLSTIVPGWNEADTVIKLKYVNDAANRIQSGQGTDLDKRTLRRFMLDSEEKLARGEDIPASVVTTLANMVPFAAEIYFTGGLAGGVKKTVEVGTRRAIVKALGKKVGKFAARELGTIGATAGFTVANPQRIAAAYMERSVPKIYEDEKGDIKISPEARSQAVDMLKAVGETALSFWTEQKGEQIVGAFKGGLNYLTGGRSGKLLGNIASAVSRRIGKTPDEVVKLMKQGRWSGIAGEMGEEQLEKTLREVLMFNDITDDENSGYWERVAKTLKPDARELLTQFLAFSIPGVTGRVLGLAKAKVFARPDLPEAVPDIVATTMIKDEIQSNPDIPTPQKEKALLYIGDIETQIVKGVVEKFPDPIVDQTSLEVIGKKIADALGITDNVVWQWDTRKTTRNQGTHWKVNDTTHKIRIRGNTEYHKNRVNLIDTIVHELGHIAKPPRYSGDVGTIRTRTKTTIYHGPKRSIHYPEFKKWVKDSVASLYEETERRVPKEGSERFAGPITPGTQAVDRGIVSVSQFLKSHNMGPENVEVVDDAKGIVLDSAGNTASLVDIPIEQFGKPEFETLAQKKYSPGRKITSPIEAVLLADGTIRITDGANRFTQAVANGDKTIPTILTKENTNAVQQVQGQAKAEAVLGSQTSTPSTTYSEGVKGAGNVWVRQTTAPTNKGRTLLVQFSSDLLTAGQEDPKAREYCDKLHMVKPGYSIPGDFWELPTWIGLMANSLPDSDVYVIRDMDEAIKFFNEAQYDTIAFSSLDVSKEFIKQIATGYQGDIAVGGYAPKEEFGGIPNITWYDDMESMVREKGGEFKEGVDYRHFKGTKTQPRLCLSKGCLHKCAFCSIPKGITESTDAVIDSQLEAMKGLDFELVYLDDKTFGQAENYKKLPDIYKRLKKAHKGFKGFIIQTTASRFNQFTDEYLKDSGIKYVELGVESYNNSILKKLHKPATEKVIDKAVEKLRQNKINFIPNIIVGLPDETAETYQRTLGFLNKNKDVISHINVYNLALYKGTELGDSITAENAEDINENQVAKSFHKHPEIVLRFAADVYDLGIELLDKSPYEAKKKTTDGLKTVKSGESIFQNNKIIPGKMVARYVKELGTEGGVSDYLSGVLKNQDYVFMEVNLDDLRSLDEDFDNYVKEGYDRHADENLDDDELGNPAVIGYMPSFKSHGLLDGTNRSSVRYANGEREVVAFVSTKSVDKLSKITPKDISKVQKGEPSEEKRPDLVGLGEAQLVHYKKEGIFIQEGESVDLVLVPVESFTKDGPNKIGLSQGVIGGISKARRLRKAIREGGLKRPFIVVADRGQKGGLRVTDGHNRLSAYVNEGVKLIPVIDKTGGKIAGAIPIVKTPAKESGEEKRGLTRRQSMVLGHKIPAMLDWDEDTRRAFNVKITGKKSMKDMTLQEVRAVAEALKQEIAAAGLEYELPDSPAEELAAVLMERPQVTPTSKLALTQSKFRNLVYTAKIWVYNYFERHNKIERFINTLDGKDDGPLYNAFFKPLLEHDLMANEVTGNEQLEFATELERLKVDTHKWMSKKTLVIGTELKLTPFDKIGIAALSKNKKSYKYLIEMGFTPTELIAINNSLSADEKAAMEFGLKKFDSQWPILKQVAILVGFDPKSLKKEFDYVPIVRSDRELEEQDDFFADMTDSFFTETAAPESGMLIKRKPRARGRLETNFAMLYFHNARRINRFVHMAPVAKQLGTILNNRSFKQALNTRTYEKGVELLKTWVKDSVKGIAISDMSWMERQMELLRKKAVVYALGHNILARSRQGLGLFTSMSTYPDMPQRALKNIIMSSGWKGHKKLEAFIYEKSLMMKQRDYDRDIRLALNQESITKRLKRENISPKSLEGISTTDKFIAGIAWKSFYDKGMEQFKGDEARAIEFADDYIRRTQSMSSAINLPAFYRGGELERVLTTFQTELATLGNYWAHDIIGAKMKGEIGWRLASYRTLVSYIIPALLFGMINRGRLPDDWGEVGFDVLTYPLAPLLFFGQLIQRAITGIETGVIALAGFESLVKVVSDVKKTANYNSLSRKEKDDLLMKAAVDAAKTFGAFSGKITIQEIRTAEGVYDLMTGKTQDWRRLVWSKWALEYDSKDRADRIMRR